MSEMSQKDSQQDHEKNDATAGSAQASGLGELLRNERENRGLSHEQLAQITRLRRGFLEALENEDWENLPPPVFVKGFIRSYGKALGLEEGRLLELYKSIVPDDVAPPIPIMVPKKARKKVPFFLLGLCLIALAVAIYLFIGRPSSEQSKVPAEKELPAQIQGEPTKVETTPVVRERPQEEVVKKQEETAETAPPRVGPAEMEIPESESKEKVSTSYPTDEDLFTQSEAAPSGSTEWRILTGIVHLRTWIRIYIDDEAPKEYILQPGSRPQWKAKKGFYVLLGNAAGMDFEFDGRDIKDIGELGQVVSLRLPEGFDRVVAEE